MNLQILQALWKVGEVRSDQVHMFATDVLEAGEESPALIRLAGMFDASWSEIERALEDAFAEGGLAPVDDRTARWRLAYETARRIVDGELAPPVGAGQLWGLANDLGLPKPLRYFVYLAADYGEGPGDRATEEAWFDARIVETARELLELRPTLGDCPPPDTDDD